MTTSEKLIQRIDQLLSLDADFRSNDSSCSVVGREVYSGTLSLMSMLYGPTSPQAATVKEANDRVMDYKFYEGLKNEYLVQELRGMLKALKADLQAGLLESITSQAKALILADFLSLAKQALEEGVKEVAAVLASAALEDALKRYATDSGLAVEDKDLSEVIAAIRTKGLIQAPQLKVMQSFVTLRNKAFHAEWSRIESAEIHSLIAFVQEFVLREFNGRQVV